MGLGKQEKMAFFPGEQMPHFEGNRGTKTILGNREHKKTKFQFLGTGEQANLFQGYKGTGAPFPPPPHTRARIWEGLYKGHLEAITLFD